MELNTKQKSGILVAALAVAALGVDRFVLGGAGPAAAAAQVLVPEAETAALPQAVTTVKADTAFAQKLERFAERHHIDPEVGIPDAFGDAEVWTVTSVLGNGERGAVRIGKDLVRVGETYQDAVLVRVDRHGGVFAKSGREFRAALRVPALPKGR
ncbi:MAG: hypothetical protein ACF8R9_13370 [Phycisphaerales bacterium JB054]